MNIKLSFAPVSAARVDLLAVILDDEKTLHAIDDKGIADHVARAAELYREKKIKRDYFVTLPEGGVASALAVYWSPGLTSWNLWENVKTCTARALRLARDYQMPRIGLVLNGTDAAPLVGKAVEGAVVGSYGFEKYKSEKDEFLTRDAQLTILAHPDHEPDAEARKARYAWVSENVNRARDLINEPGAVVTPAVIADQASEAAKELDLEVEVLDPAGLKARGYEGLLHVGQGSVHPPRMVILRHMPRKPSGETIALVGKGITFDSGGISLKPGDRMWEMKGDMAGAAAVLATLRALGRLRPDVKVVGILCCAENLPDANAQRPGDIFIAKNGKSDDGRQHRRGRAARADRRLGARRRGGRHPHRGHRHPHGGRRPSPGPERRGDHGHRPRADSPRSSAPGRTTGRRSGSCPSWTSTGKHSSTPYADINNIASGGLAGRDHRGPLPERVRSRKNGLGPPRHSRAHVPGQGLEILRGGRSGVRRQDPRRSL